MLFNAADKALWRLALPMIFSNITVPLLGLVDTAVIGHLDSPVYLGGVAVGATATSFLFMLLLFLRMSTTGMTAQALGAKDKVLLARAFVQPFLLAVLAGGVILLFRQPLMEGAFYIVSGSQSVLEQARLFIEDCKMFAEALGFAYLDSGALYRLTALAAKQARLVYKPE